MYHYAKELIRRGHYVTVFTANAMNFKPSKLKEEENINGIVVKRFRIWPLPFFSNSFFSPSMISALIRVNADVIHVFSIMSVFFTIIPCLIAKIRRVPLIMYPQYLPSRSVLFDNNPLKRA